MATEFGKRAKAARLYAGFKSQQSAANALGVSQSTIGSIETKVHSSPIAARMAKVYGVSVHWLVDGVGDMTPSNVEPGPDLKPQEYPLISNVQAGNWTALCDNFQSGDADEWYPSTKNLGRCGYILRVVGRSMYAPGEPYSFNEGMLLHINPDIVPLPGMFVIVRREGTLEATFKRYIKIDGAPYLEAINPHWPPEEKYLKLLPGDAWCGVVVDASLGKMPGI